VGDRARHAAAGPGDERSEAEWAWRGMEHGAAADAAQWGMAAAVRRSGAGSMWTDVCFPALPID